MNEWKFTTVQRQRDYEQSRSQAAPKDQSIVLQVEVSYDTAIGCGQPDLRSKSCKTYKWALREHPEVEYFTQVKTILSFTERQQKIADLLDEASSVGILNMWTQGTPYPETGLRRSSIYAKLQSTILVQHHAVTSFFIYCQSQNLPVLQKRVECCKTWAGLSWIISQLKRSVTWQRARGKLYSKSWKSCKTLWLSLKVLTQQSQCSNECFLLWQPQKVAVAIKWTGCSAWG